MGSLFSRLEGVLMTDPAKYAGLAINQPDVALIFEGGGMRNSYTAGMAYGKIPGSFKLPSRWSSISSWSQKTL